MVQERDGTRSVYLLLPYYKNGNLQDIINANLVNHNLYPELDLLKLFEQIVAGLKELHTCDKAIELIDGHSTRGDGLKRQNRKPSRQEDTIDDNGEAQMPLMSDLDSPLEAGGLAHCDIKPGKSLLLMF